MSFLSENKKPTKNDKKKNNATKNKATRPTASPKKQTALAPPKSTDFLQSFDDTFERFRQDFLNLLLPSTQAIDRLLEITPQTRIPVVDLEDRGKDYLLKAEMPGFKKEDIEIQAYEDAVEISGTAGWKYDKKSKDYICKERACESFYRMVELPEEVKVEDVQADLKEGVLEIVLTKKAPKQVKKVTIKG